MELHNMNKEELVNFLEETFKSLEDIGYKNSEEVEGNNSYSIRQVFEQYVEELIEALDTKLLQSIETRLADKWPVKMVVHSRDTIISIVMKYPVRQMDIPNYLYVVFNGVSYIFMYIGLDMSIGVESINYMIIGVDVVCGEIIPITSIEEIKCIDETKGIYMGIKFTFNLKVAEELFDGELLEKLKELDTVWFNPANINGNSKHDKKYISILGNLLFSHGIEDCAKINNAMALDLNLLDRLEKGSNCTYANCTEKAISSHNIPKSWLNIIQENEKVSPTYMGISRKNLKVNPLESVRQAGTHYTFCHKHDVDLFLNMENKNTVITDVFIYECILKSLYSKRAHLLKTFKNHSKKVKDIFNKYFHSKTKEGLVDKVDIILPELEFVQPYDDAIKRIERKDAITYKLVIDKDIDIASNINILVEDDLWLFGGAIPTGEGVIYWVAFFEDEIENISNIKSKSEIIQWFDSIPDNTLKLFILPLIFQDEDTYIKPSKVDKYLSYLSQSEVNNVTTGRNKYILDFLTNFQVVQPNGDTYTPNYNYIKVKQEGMINIKNMTK